MPGDGDTDDKNTFRILLASDIHLGYAERNAIRGNDSLDTFEEILENAQKHNVDFVLLGGDLFHENKPSRRIMHDCLSLLRKYCLGDRPVQFEFQSDQSVNFSHCQFPKLNYEDPNFNISIPVFSIHGNHDDPTGPGNLCSLDIIHSAGFINYFGKSTSLGKSTSEEKITVSPLLMQKGSTKLALYGLGSIRDERLHRLFLEQNVTMLRPKENQDDWFNLFVLHQNRAWRSDNNYIPERFLDEFLDLVVWGHEHKCLIELEHNEKKTFFNTQPGSSIATSLTEGERKQKHIGLLEIRGKKEKPVMTQIPLRTVRQFYLKDVVLKETYLDANAPDVGKMVEAFCKEEVNQLLDKADSEHSGEKKQPKDPLIHLRIDYTDFEFDFSTYRFGQLFMDKVAKRVRVANPENMITFHQRRREKRNKGLGSSASMRPQSRVEDMVKNYLDSTAQLQVLTEKGMSEAVKKRVDKDEKEAISKSVDSMLSEIQNHLINSKTDEESIDTEVVRYKDKLHKKSEDQEVQEAMEQAQSPRESNPEDSTMRSDFDQ